MSYFRNFGNVVSSQLLTKPNNLLLRPCNFPRVLCQSIEPSINHLHSVKALVQTISALKTYEQSSESQYKEEIQSQLSYLETCKEQYKVSVRKYVQSNGSLTAEAIANLYAVASELNLNKSWLQNYVQNEVPNKAQYMSRSNIQDILNSLEQSNPNFSLLQKQLSSKLADQPDYVARIGNQINQFEYCQKSKSNHPLVRALESGTSFPAYFAGKWLSLLWRRGMSYLAGPSHYYLHEN